MIMPRFIAFLTGLTGAALVGAATPADKYPESLLYDLPVEVTEGVFSSIGQLGYYSYENAGHNNNLSWVIGNEAVLVVNAGSTPLLAAALHDEIRKTTTLPVKYVVNENGQTHAAAGSSYWRDQGATVIAHRDAVSEIEAHGKAGITMLRETLKDRADGVSVAVIDETFEERMTLDLGGITAELLDLGPAHSAGDISVVIPERNVIIAGDIAFHQRMLPVFPDTDTRLWLETWHTAFAPLAKDMLIVPGHGAPTDFEQVDRYTRGYLEYLRGEVARILDEGGSLADAYSIDQSNYAHLEAFDELGGKNAGRVFEAMEWE